MNMLVVFGPGASLKHCQRSCQQTPPPHQHIPLPTPSFTYRRSSFASLFHKTGQPVTSPQIPLRSPPAAKPAAPTPSLPWRVWPVPRSYFCVRSSRRRSTPPAVSIPCGPAWPPPHPSSAGVICGGFPARTTRNSTMRRRGAPVLPRRPSWSATTCGGSCNAKGGGGRAPTWWPPSRVWFTGETYLLSRRRCSCWSAKACTRSRCPPPRR